jgi:hypothetical protein
MVLSSSANNCQSQLLFVLRCSRSAGNYLTRRSARPSIFELVLTLAQIRRLQLKFSQGSDYDIAYNHLRQLGLHMSVTAAGPSHSSAPVSKATVAAPVSSSFANSHVAQTTGPSCPPSRLTDISNRPYTALTAPTSVESQVQEAAHNRPSSAFTGYTSSNPNRDISFSGPLKPPEYFARPSSATSAILEKSYSTFPYASSDQRLVQSQEYHVSADRPDTAMLFGRPDTAEAALPPRRELPFPRSSASRAGSDSPRPSSRPSTSMMGPPPLPARVTSLRPASARAANQEQDLPPLPRPTILDSAQRQPSWMQQPPRTPNQDQVTPPSAQSMVHEDHENRSSSSSSNFSPLSYKRASSTMIPSTRPLSSLSNAAQNRRHTESNSPQSTPPTSETRRQTGVATEKIVAPQADPSEDLAAYAIQSDEGRRAALNEFIYRHIESDAFLTLLEDMETAWARASLPTR